MPTHTTCTNNDKFPPQQSNICLRNIPIKNEDQFVTKKKASVTRIIRTPKTNQGIIMASNYLKGLALGILLTPLTYTYASVIPSSVMETAQLGMPYNTDTKNIHNFICIKGTEEITGAQGGDWKFEKDMSYEQLMTFLTGSLDVAVDYPMVSLSAGANIANEYLTNEYSSAWTITAYATPKSKILTDSGTGFQITDKCREYSNIYNVNPEQKMAHIGDEFISQINYGATLLVQLKLKFANKNLKNQWDAEASGATSGAWQGKIAGFLNSLTSYKRSQVSIEFKAYQAGGDVAQLAKAIPDSFLSCSADNIQACETAFNNAISYASNFANQLIEPTKYNIISYATLSYIQAGKPELTTQANVNPANGAYINHLNRDFAQEIKNKKTAEAATSTFSHLFTNNEISNIKSIQKKIEKNTFLISKTADICNEIPYGNICENAYNDLYYSQNQYLQNYDEKDLSLPESKAEITKTTLGTKEVKFCAQGIEGTYCFDYDYKYYITVEWNSKNADKCTITTTNNIIFEGIGYGKITKLLRYEKRKSNIISPNFSATINCYDNAGRPTQKTFYRTTSSF